MPIWQPTQAIARPVYYDRQASVITKTYNAVVAPHVTTARWSYIPAVNISAFIEVVAAYMDRQGPAGPSSLSDILVIYSPVSGPAMVMDAVVAVLGAIGDSRTEVVTSFGYMVPGDQLSSTSFDASTGGTVEYSIGMKGTEFRR